MLHCRNEGTPGCVTEMGTTPFGISGALLAVLLLTPPAFAAGGEDVDRSGSPVSTLDLSYALYVGGIPLGKVALSARVQGRDYKAISTVETLGIVSTFWQSKIETSANGTLTGATVRPSLYDSFSQYRRAERRQVTLSFGPEGPRSVHSEPPYPESRYAVPETQKKNSLDPLSGAVLLISTSAASGPAPCKALAPIFDGRRRYDVGVDFLRKIDIKMANGLYSGPGLLCQVHYSQVAGYQQTLVEQGKKLPDIFAWVAPVQSTADPNRHYMLPLRIWADTEFGQVVALANEATLDRAALKKGG
jgi:hypothetical protein